MHARADGFTLVEALAALTLTALLTTALVGTAVAQMRLARAIAVRASAADAARTTAWVLAGEARRSLGVDVRAAGRDSIALRAFRGRGIVCSAEGTRMLLRYTGDRAPNPAKDSLLLMGPGGEFAAALLDVREPDGSCPRRDGEQLIRLDIDRQVGSASLVLLFESGSYYLASGAFRYRTGAEGRQPLTPEVLSRTSAFGIVDEQAIRFVAAPDSLATGERGARFPPPVRAPR